MCAGIGQKDACLDLLHRWGAQPLPLNASAWVHDTTAQPVTIICLCACAVRWRRSNRPP
jgi:hypothetical protein